MMRFTFILALVFAQLLALPATAQDNPSKRFALLIGNQTYTEAIGPLKNPHNDVALMKAALEKISFKVAVITDGSHRSIDIAIKQHTRRLRNAGPGAIGFFYYSGHGIANPNTGKNYIVPTDVQHARDVTFWDHAFEQSLIIDRLQNDAGNATHYVVFDACRDELKISATKTLNKGMVAVTNTTGILIAYATAPGRTASDAGAGGGTYAKILADEIVKPGVESRAMFFNVQDRVKQAMNQDPWLSIPALPRIYLAGKKQVASVAPPVTRPAETAAGSTPELSMKRLLRNCIRERRHFRSDRILKRYQKTLSANPHQFGWVPETAHRTRAKIDDKDLRWYGTTRVAIVDNVLEIDYAWRNGTLRLVPITSSRWGTRSLSSKYGAVAAGMQGLWATDNSYGCIELRFDDTGTARGEFGVHESKKLDTPAFLRVTIDVGEGTIPSGQKQKSAPLTRKDCEGLPLQQAIACNIEAGAAKGRQLRTALIESPKRSKPSCFKTDYNRLIEGALSKLRHHNCRFMRKTYGMLRDYRAGKVTFMPQSLNARAVCSTADRATIAEEFDRKVLNELRQSERDGASCSSRQALVAAKQIR